MKDVVENMKTFIKEQMEESEILRYVNNFPKETDYNIYQYGNLDTMSWKLLSRLYKIGYFPDNISLQTLDELYSFFDNEIIEFKYKKCVRKAVDEIVNEIETKQNKGNI